MQCYHKFIRMFSLYRKLEDKRSYKTKLETPTKNQYTFLYRNKLYKDNEAEFGKKLGTN